jgi:hypothetical protein
MQNEEQKSILQRLQVVNKYKHEPTSDDVYIGRGSPFGSPFSHLPSEHSDVTLCESREEAVDRHKEWFEDIMNGCSCKHKSLHYKIRELIVKLKLGGEVNLVCFCKPNTCHGDTIRDYILKELEK